MKLKYLSQLIKSRKDIKERKVVLDTAFKLYSVQLEICTDQFDKLKHNKK